MTAEKTVHVVDDDESVLSGIRMLLESHGQPVQTYSSAKNFLDTFDLSQPGCLVADVRMPGMGGLELLGELEHRGASLPIIFLSGHGDVPTAVRAMQSGAIDFIEKPFRSELLLARITEAIERDEKNRRTQRSAAQTQQRISRLTHREREVLNRVLEGENVAETAHHLKLSIKTIYAHRKKIMTKLHVHSLVELFRTASAALKPPHGHES